MSVINENIYDMTLISKIKERTGPKKLKKIIKNLRNLIKDDIKEFSGLKVKKFEEKKEEEKEMESENANPIIGLNRYIEDFKISNSRPILNNDEENLRENTPIIYDNEILKKFNISESSDDE